MGHLFRNTARDGWVRFLHLCVHELRTPATVVAGYLRLLSGERAGSLTDRQRQLLQEAEKSCGRLVDLINQLNELAAFDAGAVPLRREPLPLSRLLADAASRAREGPSSDGRLEIRGTVPNASVIGDLDLLRRALATLLMFALRENADGEIVEAACAVRTSGGKRWGFIGIGNAALFGPLFKRANTRGSFDEWRGGGGLSLPMARRIIEAHGGRIWSPKLQKARGTVAVALPLATMSRTRRRGT